MENQTNAEKCVFCGCAELISSNLSLPQKRSEMPVSLSRDGSPSYIESEYVEFAIKRCSKCHYVHLFHNPDPFKKSTIR